MPTLSKDIIEAAIEGFEAQKRRIDIQIADSRVMLGGAVTTSPATSPRGGKKRKFSAEALQRMREAQKKRWAKVRGESGEVETPKPKRKLSAAGRKAIAAAARKRWATKKAQNG